MKTQKCVASTKSRMSLNQLNERLANKEDYTRKKILGTVLKLCVTINTPRSLMVYMLIKHECWSELSELTINPNDYIAYSALDIAGINSFRYDYLITEIFRKLDTNSFSSNTNEVAKVAAHINFMSLERKCRSVNKRLLEDNYWLDNSNTYCHLEALKSSVRVKIVKMIGQVEYIDWTDGGWGPGTTYTLSQEKSSIAHKISEYPIQSTKANWKYYSNAISNEIMLLCYFLETPVEGPCCLLLDSFKIDERCRFATVPKNAKTDRGITIEQTANIYTQAAVGNYLRKRLRYNGCDLRDQSKNQYLASIAHDVQLATVDLANASDSISHAVISELFPLDWVNLFDDLRSKVITYPELSDIIKPQMLHKLSGQGNGFTFPVETMLFLACSEAVAEYRNESIEHVSVYGDDIIIPQSCVSLLVDLFDHLGFSINHKKTHQGSDCFYESCGKHYFHGCDVTPIYIKSLDRTIGTYIRNTNRVTRYIVRNLSSDKENKFRNWLNTCFVDSFLEDIPRELIKYRPLHELLSCETDSSFLTYDFNNGYYSNRLSLKVESNTAHVKPIIGYMLWHWNERNAHLSKRTMNVYHPGWCDVYGRDYLPYRLRRVIFEDKPFINSSLHTLFSLDENREISASSPIEWRDGRIKVTWEVNVRGPLVEILAYH